MSSIQSASRRTGLAPTSKIAWRGVTPPTRGSANGRSISRSAPGAQTVSESSTTTTSVVGSVSRRPAAIAARLPTFGRRSTRSQYSAAIAAISRVAAVDDGDQLGRAVRDDARERAAEHRLGARCTPARSPSS